MYKQSVHFCIFRPTNYKQYISNQFFSIWVSNVNAITAEIISEWSLNLFESYGTDQQVSRWRWPWVCATKWTRYQDVAGRDSNVLSPSAQSRHSPSAPARLAHPSVAGHGQGRSRLRRWSWGRRCVERCRAGTVRRTLDWCSSCVPSTRDAPRFAQAETARGECRRLMYRAHRSVIHSNTARL